uniref:Uncharacterized protein n=1 Tax=Candidatus Kentrum sp. LFY TaxID=2126342 RepID=A0A450WL22_9GAMM|nr:MAG: hypothetical protein BECKLFY1418C_GA0070996_103513 [Candidatus Kentron sp. LFY]
MSSHKVPSLHVGYKPSKIKQYFKEDHALRTETTINNTYDFGLDCRLENLPDLRAIGFAANCHLLEVETISQDCSLAEGVFEQITRPRVVDGKRVSGLRFDDQRAIGFTTNAVWISAVAQRIFQRIHAPMDGTNPRNPCRPILIRSNDL